ncbi:UNVERIFIED_CONTAM: hypothetical protein GTU68_043445 [Idotea baltica]|nr:hypothetical protein [Idotea baltica]
MFGGRSAEHEISILSAKSVLNSIDKDKFDVVLIAIDKLGNWQEVSESFLLEVSEGGSFGGQGFLGLKDNKKIDVAFPILHGPYGEDGSIQGLLKVANIAFVGADVLGSAVGMDKDIMKKILIQDGFNIGKYKSYFKNEIPNISFDEVEKDLGLPIYIKPANLGSSVGINRVNNKEDFLNAIEEAFTFDNKIIIETNIVGRELECAVLGNQDPKASFVGEVITNGKFYSYQNKYFDKQASETIIPAELDAKILKEIQSVAVGVFKSLNTEGYARVDVFLNEDSQVIVNEINTIPGFTDVSMYPKLWESSGISYPKLIEELITLAMRRYQINSELKLSY